MARPVWKRAQKILTGATICAIAGQLMPTTQSRRGHGKKVGSDTGFPVPVCGARNWANYLLSPLNVKGLTINRPFPKDSGAEFMVIPPERHNSIAQQIQTLRTANGTGISMCCHLSITPIQILIVLFVGYSSSQVLVPYHWNRPRAEV